MHPDQALHLLKNNSLFWSRLGFEYDPPMRDEHGELLSFDGDYARFANYHRKMFESGVKLHTTILFSGWVGADEYDYTFTDRTLDALFQAVPDACYIPRVKLNAPLAWSRENPGELFVYYGGPTDPEEIRPLVGTLRHDLLGYESPEGYYMGKDKRPNLNGVISNQSFASKKWRRDAAEALRRLIEHLQNGPYAERIIGIHIAYGTSGESCLWGRCSGRFGDYSCRSQQAFRDWGVARYGSEAALLEAWGSLELPPPEARAEVNDSLCAFARSRKQDKIAEDFDRFISDLNTDILEEFGRTAKEASGGNWLTGAFYGYMLECYNAAYTGHLGYEKLLNSPWIDFWAGPMSYCRREAGESGGYLAVAGSVNRRKLWVDELDIRTSRAADTVCSSQPEACDRAVLTREFAKNLATGSGYWWMDLGGGWFDAPHLYQTVSELEQCAARLRARPAHSTADILALVDEESQLHCTQSLEYHYAGMQLRLRELTLTGAKIDIARRADLPSLDRNQYKLIVLCHVVKLTRQEREWLTGGNGFLVGGFLDGSIGDAFSVRNTESLFGLKLRETGAKFPAAEVRLEPPFSGTLPFRPNELPAIVPDDPAATVFARFPDGTAAMATRDGKRVYTSLPFLSWREFRELARRAGCRFYGDAPCTVYGDNRFTAIFSHEHPEQYTVHEHLEETRN